MTNVTNVAHLSAETIKDLLYGGAKIVLLESPYDAALTSQISDKINTSMSIGYYENAPKIGRIGMAFFESINNPDKREDYYRNARKWNSDLKNACFPLLSPISYLISKLDNNWEPGAKLASFRGNKMFSGLARIFKDGSSAEPHQDIFLRDAPEVYPELPIKEQIAFNIYLDVPEHGGELEIWDWKASDEEFLANRHADPSLSYGMNRKKIRPPDLTYKPKKGDIIFFNPRNVHAVSASYGTPRLTISTFIGLSAEDKELLLWS